MDTKEKRIVPVRENMWTENADGTVTLLGNRCPKCGEEFFPRRDVNYCPHCQADALDDIEFAGDGKIISYTTVLNRPAGNFYMGPVPFNYVLVKLNHGDVIVQGHYEGVEPDEIHIGDPVQAVPAVMWEDETSIVTAYKFVPAKKEA